MPSEMHAAAALDFPQGHGLIQEEMEVPVERPLPEFATRNASHCCSDPRISQFYHGESAGCASEGVRSMCCIPLITHDRVLGTLSREPPGRRVFQQDVDLLVRWQARSPSPLKMRSHFRKLRCLKINWRRKSFTSKTKSASELNFDEIVGESPSLTNVLKQVETVAPTDSTVLIQGETGTGKELIARAIHNLSPRRERTFVKVNCAAIPTGLLESELFGHERGAFTGAIAQSIGRFELADGGTLFLDEVGDIPLELQPKLLRVLQEQEFERLGSTRTIRVDVRLVAATNRDLGEMVAERQFRSDLFYRLNVFPLHMPPLRERREDIPALVRYFAEKYARQMNRTIDTIPPKRWQLSRLPLARKYP